MEGRTINVGYAGFWPYVFYNPSVHRLDGVDVVLMNLLEKRMKFKIKIAESFFNRPVAEIIGKVRKDRYFIYLPRIIECKHLRNRDKLSIIFIFWFFAHTIPELTCRFLSWESFMLVSARGNPEFPSSGGKS